MFEKIFDRFRTTITKDPDTGYMTMDFQIHLLDNFFESYVNMVTLGDKIADRIVDEVYPEVKDKIMSDKEFIKILNEVRIKLANKIIEK